MRTNAKKVISLFIFLSFISSVETLNGQTVIEQLKNNGETVEFGKALEKTNIDERLNKSGPFTLLAPSNKAFAKLQSAQKSNSNLLLNHIFTGLATKRSLMAMSEVTCLSGRTITLRNTKDQELSVESYRIIAFNIKADNGVIHIIDGVIK